MNDLDRIEAYLAALPPEKRVVLDDWRARIRALVPDSIEVFSYGMPMFKWRGKGLAAYAATKNHFGYYPVSSNTISELATELACLKTSKGAIRFTHEEPLDDVLLKTLIQTRKAEIERSTK